MRANYCLARSLLIVGIPRGICSVKLGFGIFIRRIGSDCPSIFSNKASAICCLGARFFYAVHSRRRPRLSCVALLTAITLAKAYQLTLEGVHIFDSPFPTWIDN
uniref:Group II intron-associated open reading frame n=1 Tax=Phlegmariurus squarrosus TaxID=73615 RepID=H9M8C9_PHLSQ|nr:group II intron-associated open reading frame [Phlegmariurus squarrosus]AEV55836.1 group II intron-associated open reading frame [Phlegmariurus squarrosus]